MKKALAGIFLLWLISICAAQITPLISLNSSSASGACGGNGFAICKTISFDHTKVGTVNNTNQSSFPALISGTYSFLAVTGSGGSVQNTVAQTGGSGITVAADAVFTSDSGCTTSLKWEFENYVSTTGAVTIWVQVPTLSHSADTSIYLCVGKSSVTTWQGNVTGTWDSNFLGIYHLDSSSGSYIDSTSNSRTISMACGSAAYATGQIYNGTSLNATTKNSGGSTTGLLTGSSITGTLEIWFKLASSPGTDQAMIGWTGCTSGGCSAGTSYTLKYGAGSSNRVCLDDNSGGTCIAYTADTSWHHLVATSTGASSTIAVYLDGVLGTNTTSAGAFNVGANASAIGNLAAFGTGCTTSAAFKGTLDEGRMSKVARSADWIKTEYNNQSSPGTFYAVRP